jgi:hypothetical protein
MPRLAPVISATWPFNGFPFSIESSKQRILEPSRPERCL